jgi:hypothetical protein
VLKNKNKTGCTWPSEILETIHLNYKKGKTQQSYLQGKENVCGKKIKMKMLMSDVQFYVSHSMAMQIL